MFLKAQMLCEGRGWSYLTEKERAAAFKEAMALVKHSSELEFGPASYLPGQICEYGMPLTSFAQAEVVKLRFFVGMSHAEIASVLGISEKTSKRYWAHAKAWLSQRIKENS